MWEWFWQVRNKKGSHEHPLSHGDILNWLAVEGHLVTRRECDMLFSMDLAFRKGIAEEIRANTERANAVANKPKGGRKWQTM